MTTENDIFDDGLPDNENEEHTWLSTEKSSYGESVEYTYSCTIMAKKKLSGCLQDYT